MQTSRFEVVRYFRATHLVPAYWRFIYPMHEVFPVRYYLIDFELSVRFPENSRSEDRVVTGMPLKRLGLEDPEDYGRDIAPEMLSGEPYDPFKTDVFQMGKMFHDHFHVRRHLFLPNNRKTVTHRPCLFPLQALKDDVPELVAIFAAMMADRPNSRLTAGKALDEIRAYEKTLTRV
jgi:hypothetical protein